MNPRLTSLQPYPFQRLRDLLQGATPDSSLAPINLSIGEPAHPTPSFIQKALCASAAGLARYPTTQGGSALREALAVWLKRRFRLGALPDPDTQVLPVNGSREALFAFAQAVVDPAGGQTVVMPNPFYQIYEGAALLAGARPYYLNCTADNGFRPDFESVPATVWAQTALVYVCTPGNPTGQVLSLDDWKVLFALADRHGFVIASDECYSEIYFEEGAPPIGGLEAAQRLGLDGYRRLVVFGSLSKRSNVPGLRSGFVAGDAGILKDFLLYRTYHGSAMDPAVQAASVMAWGEESHVRENRALYREKFARVLPLLEGVLDARMPEAAFYVWAKTPVPDTEFVRRLYAERHLTVLPGSFLARPAHGLNPGAGYVRIALVAPLADCLEAAGRLRELCRRL